MFSIHAFVSEMSAQEVADIVQNFYQNAGLQRYFKLEFSDTAGENEREVWVRPRLSVSPIELANGDQIIRCESQAGELVDIIVPRSHREYVPATVVIAAEAPPGTDM